MAHRWMPRRGVGTVTGPGGVNPSWGLGSALLQCGRALASRGPHMVACIDNAPTDRDRLQPRALDLEMLAQDALRSYTSSPSARTQTVRDLLGVGWKDRKSTRL